MSTLSTPYPIPPCPHDWEPPVYFDDQHTPEIQTQWLPGVFREFSAALAHATETPAALSVMTVLGILSAVAMQRVVVSPQPQWYEPINLYTLIALPPANHKSLVLKRCLKPLIDWEKEQALRLKPEIQRLFSERKTQEKRIETLRAQAAKSNSHLEYLQRRAEVLEQEEALPEIPVAPLLFVNDVTPESLANTLHEQGGRLALFSDEGGLLETLAGLYSHGSANIDILLKGIDGGDVRVRRKDRCFSLNPYLTILLAIQPAVVRRLVDKKAYVGNGALDRFLYVFPQSKLGYRTHQTPPLSDDLQNAYAQHIQSLLDTVATPVKTSATPTRTVLTLDPAAQAAWRAYQAEIEVQLRPDGRLSSCLGWAGKLSGFVLRLAGLLHLADQGIQTTVIAATVMDSALSLAQALADHALAAFGVMRQIPAHEDAQTLFLWVRQLKQPHFTQSAVTYAWRHHKWERSRLLKALQVLSERHLISRPVKLPTRKPTRLYYVHPEIVTERSIDQ